MLLYNKYCAFSSLKTSLLDATNNICGMTKKGVYRKETWWWNDEVNNAVVNKRRAWKEWKKGGSKEEYLKLKRDAKHTAEDAKFKDLDHKDTDVFRLAKSMKQENSDVIGEKCVRNNDDEMAMTHADKKLAWKQHYEQLLNVEFTWNKDNLSPAKPVSSPPVLITADIVSEAIKTTKPGKASGPSGIVAEMLKASGNEGITINHLPCKCYHQGKYYSK